MNDLMNIAPNSAAFETVSDPKDDQLDRGSVDNKVVNKI
jgi:hypothetical protein